LRFASQTAIPLAVAAGTAAAFLWLRQKGAEVPPILWLAVLTAVGITAVLFATRGRRDAIRVDRVWPEWTALLISTVLALGRVGLPDLFNADLEAEAIVYATAVVVLFVALRKTVLGHRWRSPRAVAHAFTCVAAATATVVVSAAILYLE
jgi:hypothetical protein